MTSRLETRPEVFQLARDLGLGVRGDPVQRIRNYVDNRVRECLSFLSPSDATGLLRLVAAYFSIQLEFIYTDADVDRLAVKYEHFSSTMGKQLRADFIRGSSLGYLVCNPRPAPGDRIYVAFIDARGLNRARAYFTAWHEIAHVILTPEQLRLSGFRRTTVPAIEKDPVESMVDSIASDLAFFDPLLMPVLDDVLGSKTSVGFEEIDEVRRRFAPEASIQTTAIAVIGRTSLPSVFIVADLALKAGEQAQTASGQLAFLSVPRANQKLRAITVVASQAARRDGWKVFKNMRVPSSSVIHRAFLQPDAMFKGAEDQSAWETSTKGALPPLMYSCEAKGFGTTVYALLNVVN